MNATLEEDASVYTPTVMEVVRKQLRLTQYDLARLARIEQSEVSQAERRLRDLKKTAAQAIGEVLKLRDPNDLLKTWDVNIDYRLRQAAVEHASQN